MHNCFSLQPAHSVPSSSSITEFTLAPKWAKFILQSLFLITIWKTNKQNSVLVQYNLTTQHTSSFKHSSTSVLTKNLICVRGSPTNRDTSQISSHKTRTGKKNIRNTKTSSFPHNLIPLSYTDISRNISLVKMCHTLQNKSFGWLMFS